MKNTKKLVALAISSMVGISLLVTAPAHSAACSSRTKFTMEGTIKREIEQQFMSAVKDYNASQSCYTLEVYPNHPSSDTFLSIVTPKYAAHNAATIMYALQEIPQMADKVIGWNGSPLAGLVPSNLLAAATIKGKIVGIPSTVEAFGLLYNKAVLDKAGVDPTKIATRSDLEAAFKALQAKGFNAIHFSDVWWSLGAHFMNEYFTHAGATSSARLKVLDSLANGSKNLSNDPTWNDYVATFDLLKKYSDNTNPTFQDTEFLNSVADLASGKTGFLFQGNWAEPNLLQADPKGSYGIMNLPMNNDPKGYGNDSIAVGVPGYFMIDRIDSTAAQRQGAKDFLTWLYTSPAGQHHVADAAGQNGAGGMGFIPVYNGFKVQAATYMAGAIAKYVGANKTLEWVNTYFPAGGQNIYGDLGQKYMVGKITAADYAKGIQDAWKGKPKTWRGEAVSN